MTGPIRYSKHDVLCSPYNDWVRADRAQAAVDAAAREARTEALSRFTCSRCDTLIELLMDPQGDAWWVHAEHPEDGHDAIPMGVSKYRYDAYMLGKTDERTAASRRVTHVLHRYYGITPSNAQAKVILDAIKGDLPHGNV